MRPVFEDTVEDKISYARQAVVFAEPYFASIVHGFVYVPMEGIRTMLCTPKLVLGYDPEWVRLASIKELAADIAHEVQHFMRKHFERTGKLNDPVLFNLAADLAINPDLRNAGYELADEKSARPAIFPKHYNLPEGLSTEEYYTLLQQMQAAGTLGTMGGSAGNGICSGNCGGIAGGADHESMSAALDAKEGRNEIEIISISKRAADDIKRHIETHGRGKLPKSIAEFAQALIEEPHVRWQAELAHVIRSTSGRIQSGGEDFSMSRPSKRSFVRGLVRPGMVEYQPEVCIVRDTSGSMNTKQLTDCTRESYHIMQALGIDEVWFADADANVAMPWKRVGPAFFRNLKDAHGRGGTSFIPAIAAASKLSPRPDLLIYCTDGDGDAPKCPPQGMSVVWAIIMGGYARAKAPAHWGHTVVVSEDPRQRRAKPLPPDADD
jgi:predicted metal-dependent peptidase